MNEKLAVQRAFAKAVHNLRKQRSKKLAQEALALEAEMNRSFLSGLELGKHEPCLWTLWRLKTGFNISLARLAQEIEAHYTPPKKR